MRKFTFAASAAALSLLTSCATIVSHSETPVTLGSSPDGATVAITDRHGKSVFTGTTPTVAVLKHGNGFFQRGVYTIRIEKPGYEAHTGKLEATVNGWYWGNLVFGGFIGFLIVDPASGAMYTIPQTNYTIGLKPAATGFLPDPSGKSLRVVSLDEIPAEQRAQLVRISD